MIRVLEGLSVFGLGAACWFAFDALAALCGAVTGSEGDR